MGSYDAAVMTGFICRLCSELNRSVVHIYSDKGMELNLAEKINLMPISVEPQDSLPKTVCESCVTQLDSQYRLIQQLKRTRERFLQQRDHIGRAGNLLVTSLIESLESPDVNSISSGEENGDSAVYSILARISDSSEDNLDHTF